jgi:hypothetical protein
MNNSNLIIQPKVFEDESIEYELAVMKEKLNVAIECADWNLLDPEVLKLCSELNELINQLLLANL